MNDILQHLPQIFSTYLVYLVAVISPGPATMAIASASIGQGRSRGIAAAAGIFAGSATWATAASLGLAALLTHYAQSLVILRILGGLYMLYLAWRAFRSATTAADPAQWTAGSRQSLKRNFLLGYAVHLTNPKAIFGWLAIISLGLPPNASATAVALIVGGCLVTGFSVFMGYALLFSTPRALKVYKSARRAIDGTLGVLFAAAGTKLLLTR